MPRDVVFTFFHETWAAALERKFMPPDRLAPALLTHPQVGGLLIADPYRSAPLQWARRAMGRPPPPAIDRPRAARIGPYRLRRSDPTGEAALRRTYAAYDRVLADRARAMGLQTPAMITTNPFVAAFAPLEWAHSVTYYAWDEWAALQGHGLERWWPDFAAAYAAIRARGARVCAVSAPLLANIGPTGAGIVVPNGVTPEEWAPPWRTPDWLGEAPSPRILYIGSIHRRLDLDAIRATTARLPNATVLVVGPTAEEHVADELRRMPGVQVRDALPRDTVAGLVRAADVCILPHLRTPLTESMSPLKVYEYCAAGRPVAATELPPIRGIHERVRLAPAGDPEAFADAVERALADGPMSEGEREAFVRDNSWTRRFDQILEVAFA